MKEGYIEKGELGRLGREVGKGEVTFCLFLLFLLLFLFLEVGMYTIVDVIPLKL